MSRNDLPIFICLIIVYCNYINLSIFIYNYSVYRLLNKYKHYFSILSYRRNKFAFSATKNLFLYYRYQLGVKTWIKTK